MEPGKRDFTNVQLGNYRLVRFLGHGGFADVYLARQIYLDSPAAIKLLRTNLAQEDLEGFREEAQREFNRARAP